MCDTAACKAEEPILGETAGTFLQGTIKKWICLHGPPRSELVMLSKVSLICSCLGGHTGQHEAQVQTCRTRAWQQLSQDPVFEHSIRPWS